MVFQDSCFFCPNLPRDVLNRVHRPVLFVDRHQRFGKRQSLRASYLDGMVHFVRSLLDLCGKKGHAILLERVIPGQTSDPPDLGFEAIECIAIGAQGRCRSR